MAIRFAISGTAFECDTPDEAFGIIKALQGSQIRKREPMQKITKNLNKQNSLFENAPGKLLLAMKKAYPRSLSTSELADALHCSPKGLPPIFLGLRKRIKRCGFDYDEMISRKQSFERGKPIGQYALTEKAINDIQWPIQRNENLNGKEEKIEDKEFEALFSK